MNKTNKFNKLIKKLRWYSYVEKRRHEDKLLNELEGIYGKDAIFIFGDWSGKGKIHYMSTPNIGLKNLLATRFTVYLINEYNTSKLFHLNGTEGGHLKVKVEYGKENGQMITGHKELHSVLTFKMGNDISVCINRDYNAVLNMMKILEGLILNKVRPELYCRKQKEKPKTETIIEDIEKTKNPKTITVKGKRKCEIKKPETNVCESKKSETIIMEIKKPETNIEEKEKPKQIIVKGKKHKICLTKNLEDLQKANP